MVLATQPLIGRYEHLKNRPKSDQALPLLEKIASQVKPIMAKRDWKVGTLGEFFPSDPSLLGINMNAGQRINLRLRPPGSPDGFYEFDQLVLVMLHELTHIQHGPHDASFYKLLAVLEEEYYDLKRKGYSGEGFHSSGNQLSGLKIDEYHGKHQGLKAAERRLATQRKIGKGGVLGGGSVLGRSMKDVLAEAAERRMKDDKICHTGAEVDAEIKKAQDESEGVNADQLGDGSGNGNDPIKSTGLRSGDGIKAGSGSDAGHPKAPSSIAKPLTSTIPKERHPSNPQYNQSSSASSSARPRPIPRQVAEPPIRPKPKPQIIDLTEDDDDDDNNRQDSTKTEVKGNEWSCPTCTLLNPISSRSCEACTTPNPLPASLEDSKNRAKDGWYCDFCGSGPRDMSYWSCGECGWVRKWG